MHDPTAFAWIIVLAYAGGALLCLAAARPAAGRDRMFWCLTAASLLLLGLNKQLDLQMLALDAARDWARADGWYESRRLVQAAFFFGLAVGACLVAIALALWLRRSAAAVKLAAAGLLLLTAFVLVRAASVSHIDEWVTVTVAGLRSGWWLELAGIGLIAGAAIISVRAGRDRGRVRTPSAAACKGRA